MRPMRSYAASQRSLDDDPAISPPRGRARRCLARGGWGAAGVGEGMASIRSVPKTPWRHTHAIREIGRASWRARVGQYGLISGVGVTLKKKTENDEHET